MTIGIANKSESERSTQTLDIEESKSGEWPIAHDKAEILLPVSEQRVVRIVGAAAGETGEHEGWRRIELKFD